LPLLSIIQATGLARSVGKAGSKECFKATSIRLATGQKSIIVAAIYFQELLRLTRLFEQALPMGEGDNLVLAAVYQQQRR